MSTRRWLGRTAKALCWAVILLPVLVLALYYLDTKNIPWEVAITTDSLIGHDVTFFRDIHSWLFGFMNRWGNLVTFLIGFTIGLLIPNRTENQTDQILQFIRGNLLDFESVYTQVCELLEEMAKDEASCFVMVSQSPLLGADLYPKSNNRFYRLMMGRVTKRNRVVSLSPYGNDSMLVDTLSSSLRKFYNDLERYNPSKRGALISRQTERSAAIMFNEAAMFIVDDLATKDNIDVVFADQIPYQVFIGRKSNGERKCILLLNGWDAIKKHLPSGGFVSEDPTFLQLIEESIQIMLGTDRNIYEIRHAHTKRILEKCYEYASDCGNPETAEKVDTEKIRKVDVEGLQFGIYPYVFDPEISESAKIMVKTTLQILEGMKTTSGARQLRQVWDIGCGCGALSILAAKAGNVKVKAIDVNLFACECTRRNAATHNVDSDVDVILNKSIKPSDVFKCCTGQKADLILADLPFLNCHPYARDERLAFLQMAYFDCDQQLNIQVLKQAKDYLNDDGALIISFSDLDSVSEFHEKIIGNDWQIKGGSEKPYHHNNHDWYAFILSPK